MNDDEELTKSVRIDLGLAVMAALSRPGVEHTQEEVAAWCDCSIQTVRTIEHRALEKLRSALRQRDVC